MRADEVVDESDTVGLRQEGDLVQHLEPDAVAAEGRLVGGDDRHPAETAFEQAHDFRDQLRIGAGVRDDLGADDDVRGVEQMHPQKVALEAVAAPVRHLRDGQSGRYRGDDGIGSAALVDAGEEGFLELQVLGHRFEDQVRLGDGFFKVLAVGPDGDAVGNPL